jgi:hypothetical protein
VPNQRPGAGGMPCRPFPKGRTWRSLRRRRSRGSMWIDRGSRSSSGPGLWQGRCAQHSHRVTHQTGDCRTCAVLNCECGTETWRSRASGTASPRPPDAWQDTEPAVHTLRTPSPNYFVTCVTGVSLYLKSPALLVVLACLERRRRRRRRRGFICI